MWSRTGGRSVWAEEGKPFFSLSRELIPGHHRTSFRFILHLRSKVKVHALWCSKKEGRARMNGSPLRFCECVRAHHSQKEGVSGGVGHGQQRPLTAHGRVEVATLPSRFKWETQKGGSSSRNLCTLCCARAASLPIWGFFRRFGGERKERLLGRVALSFLPGCGRLSNG